MTRQGFLPNRSPRLPTIREPIERRTDGYRLAFVSIYTDALGDAVAAEGDTILHCATTEGNQDVGHQGNDQRVGSDIQHQKDVDEQKSALGSLRTVIFLRMGKRCVSFFIPFLCRTHPSSIL